MQKWIKMFTQRNRSVEVRHLWPLRKDIEAPGQAKAPECTLPADTMCRLDSPPSTIRAEWPSTQIRFWAQNFGGEWLAAADIPPSIVHESSTILLFVARKDWLNICLCILSLITSPPYNLSKLVIRDEEIS